MPRLTIDHLAIEVPEGTKVIEAAERLGIMIPRFCYHPALGSVGACRVCAVRFLEGPVKGIEMSCMQEARDGMVVSTTDPEAMEFRKYVIEWLMLHHPLDCPVCDEGGHCLLQDETVSGGHAIRRYAGKKRTYRDQYLGPFVQHEMNRCIHCFRCRRFYQDYAGSRDLGAMQIGNRMYFGRFSDGALESPFSGNLIDVCPTGVYTDRPSRFVGRRWDFERGPSVCLQCSLGCSTTGSARYRAIVRQEGRVNRSVNGYFICDRGRYGFDYTNLPERPRRSRVRGEEVSMEEGILAAAEALKRVSLEAGPEAIACLGSTRSSLEGQAALRRFCRQQGWPVPGFFLDPGMARTVRKAVSRMDGRLAVSMAGIEKADLILALGADPVNEAPMLAVAMRQAYRRGAAICAIDPRPLALPFEFEHLALSPGRLERCLAALVRRAVGRRAVEGLGPGALRYYDALPGAYPSDQGLQERLAGLGQKLEACQRPVIICGTDIVPETTPGVAADLALLLRAMKGQAGLFYILPGPNAFGAGLLSQAGEALPVTEGIEQGAIKALMLVECDPFFLYPDRRRLAGALEKLDFLLVMDCLPSEAVERAHVVLPTTTVFERTASHFVNQEGRLQRASPIHKGGAPIAQVSGHGHPPRTFLADVPGGNPRPASDLLGELSTALSGKREELSGYDLRASLAGEGPGFERLTSCAGEIDGLLLVPEESPDEDFRATGTVPSEGAPVPDGHLELLLVEQTFGTEELSGYSRIVAKVERPLRLQMHRGDAAKLGLSDADRVHLTLDGRSLALELDLSENIAPGVMILPRYRELVSGGVKGWRMIVP